MKITNDSGLIVQLYVDTQGPQQQALLSPGEVFTFTLGKHSHFQARGSVFDPAEQITGELETIRRAEKRLAELTLMFKAK